VTHRREGRLSNYELQMTNYELGCLRPSLCS